MSLLKSVLSKGHSNKLRNLKSAYWKTLDGASPKQAMTLETENSQSPREFYAYGCRLADWAVKRFELNSQSSVSLGTLVDVGCGMGRQLLPFSTRFKQVYGVDFSQEMLDAARVYCRDVPNLTLHQCDGQSLGMFENDSVDYVFSGGVFQHIIYFDVIAGYIKEGLRILKPGGLFMFQFQVWQKEKVGSGRVGAKMTAKALDEALCDEHFKLLELTNDPKDPLPHFAAIITKTNERRSGPKFQDIEVKEVPYRTSLITDIPSMQGLFKEERREVTFFDS